MYSTVKTVMMTPNPNWGDEQALLEYLFATEERRMILEKAREGLTQEHGGVPNANTYLPKEDLEWDPNTSEGLQRVKEYQKLILYGIQHGVQKPKNLSKLSEVRQGDKETPSAFYERLCEIARKWTDLDPEDDSNSKLFNMLFIGQAAADIRKKLQKVKSADGMTISQLLSIAYKVYNNREEIEEKERRGRARLQAALLAALTEGQEKGRVAKKWTDLDPEREANALTFVTLFVGQSNPDIRRKLQKIEGEEARSMNKLLEVVWKVYNNREEEEKKRQEKEQVKRESRKAQLLAAAIAEGNQNSRRRNDGYRLNGGTMMTSFFRPGEGKPLNKDQCALCKQKGHWKRDCPQNQFRRNFPRKQEDPKVEELLTLGQDSD
ncbi:hypothetical protein QYF61_008747 [Mycteria americana]|uniref:CCHC-type domain-containing protein n=1 Tax=Mycteria americana TaxID=33587 RepID=A0AAN7N8R7_MYCAM|nr:hypothetical protein QYF61_008747 [Mycteria americana]